MMNVDAFLAELTAARDYRGQIVAHHRLPPEPARTAPLEPPLPAELSAALAAVGIGDLYSHQVEAITRARAAIDQVIVTGTASGKTWCYNLPVIERLLTQRSSRALYLFPLKALAHDQLRKLAALDLWQRVRCATYDGDTPLDERRAVRSAANLVLTNPDMLHLGILPRHDLWASFLAGLEFIVLDEIHVYRGVFGSHLAHVLRRLLRLCERYGSRPTFICCSATVANPAVLARELTGRDFEVVWRSGAPRGAKHVVVWNPPVQDEATGLRRSGNVEATQVIAELVRRRIRVLGFARARQEAELVLRYLRAELEDDSGLPSPRRARRAVGEDDSRLPSPRRGRGAGGEGDSPSPRRGRGAGGEGDSASLATRVSAYRAGYLATERRDIEQRLSGGDLLAVVSTVALEAGIDIGGLDATVMVGYPGTVAGFWQQAGRSGRGAGDSLAVLVTRASLIDQYFAAHPEQLWSAPTEAAMVDPDNPYVLAGHLLCAAYEQPLAPEDLPRFGPRAAELVAALVAEDYLTVSDGRWYFTGVAYPAAEISLRAASNDAYALLNEADGQVLGHEDTSRLWDECFPGAVHLHEGEQYRVASVDDERHEVRIWPVEVDFYTAPQVDIVVAIDTVAQERTAGEVALAFGDLTVTKTTVGYRQYRVGGQELLATVPLECPPQSVETCGFWLTVSPEVRDWLAQHEVDPMAALHAVEHALTGVLPLVALCDPRDVGGSSTAWHETLAAPALFVFDQFPGGIGLAERGYETIDLLLRQAHDVVAGCACTTGCPACIQTPNCGLGNQPLDKLGALVILRAALGEAWSKPLF